MFRYVFLILSITLVCSINAQTTKNTISGLVTDYGQPKANVNISIKGTMEGIQTDAQGKYSINANPGDVLVFSYVGMKTIEIIVEDVTSTLNIAMVPKIEELDEVVVQQKKRENQEQLVLDYGSNKNIIRTAYGYLDTENAGYAVNVIDGSELNPAAIDIISALQAKLPGTRVVDFGSGSQTGGGATGKGILIRGGGSVNNPKPAIFEVDGTIFTSAPDFLIIDNIDRVAVLPGLAAVVRYGNIAAGGVIIINTKGNNIIREPGTNKAYDQAKLRNNVFDERSVQSYVEREPPKYIRDMEAAKTLTKAEAIYGNQKKLYGSSPYFYLESADYFKEKWNSAGKDRAILKEMNVKYADNPVALKALAYTLEETDQLQEALAVYIDIFKMRPRYAQSYRDLANMYTLTENYTKALGLYARYQTSRRLDTVTGFLQGIDAIIRTESDNLMAVKATTLGGAEVQAKTGDYAGIRILIEWNNSEAEFDLQFVNPEHQYSIWSHTLESNEALIMDEKTKGYSSEQFLIDRSLPGRWRINLKYYGNKSYEPTSFKATVYYDYGTPAQRRVIKVFDFSELNVNRELFSIVNP